MDSIGGEVFPQLVRLTKPGGRIVTFGATRGPVPQLVMPFIFLKQLDILGSTMGNNEEFRQMVNLFESTASVRSSTDPIPLSRRRKLSIA